MTASLANIALFAVNPGIVFFTILIMVACPLSAERTIPAWIQNNNGLNHSGSSGFLNFIADQFMVLKKQGFAVETDAVLFSPLQTENICTPLFLKAALQIQLRTSLSGTLITHGRSRTWKV